MSTFIKFTDTGDDMPLYNYDEQSILYSLNFNGDYSELVSKLAELYGDVSGNTEDIEISAIAAKEYVIKAI